MRISDWSSDVCSSDLSQVAKVDKRWFIGLASPAAAGLMASFVGTCHGLDLCGDDLRYAALAVTVVSGLLMVSSLRYNSFKGGRGPKGDRVPFFALLIAVAVIIALVIAPAETLLAAGTLYALSGPVMWLRRRKLPPSSDAEPPACPGTRCSRKSWRTSATRYTGPTGPRRGHRPPPTRE